MDNKNNLTVKSEEKKENCFDVELKETIVEYSFENGNRAAAKQFIDKKSIGQWKNDNKKLCKTNPKLKALKGPKNKKSSKSNSKLKALKGPKTEKIIDIDQEVEKCFNSQQEQEMPVTKRNCYDLELKRKIVQYSFTNGNRAAARKFRVDETNIRRWKKDYKKLCKGNPKKKAFKGPKTGKFNDIDQQVMAWINSQREKGMIVTTKMVCLKAIQLARERDIGPEVFKASIGWCKRLMRRFGFTTRITRIKQKPPNDYENKLIEFQRLIINLRKKYNYSLGDIGDADETFVYFNMPSQTKIEKCGAETVSIRSTASEKQRILVMLTVLADGTKLPPFIILKRKKLPKEELPEGIYVGCQERGLMTTELMIDWFSNIWLKRPNACLNKNERSLLVLDVSKGHLIKDEFKHNLNNTKTDLAIIPGGMTSLLQVLNVGIYKSFQNYFSEYYNNWLAENIHEYTSSGRIKKPSISNLCNWILKAWEKITPTSIKTGFIKCCISNALDGIEDHFVWEENMLNGNNYKDEIVHINIENYKENSDIDEFNSDDEYEQIKIEIISDDEMDTKEEN